MVNKDEYIVTFPYTTTLKLFEMRWLIAMVLAQTLPLKRDGQTRAVINFSPH